LSNRSRERHSPIYKLIERALFTCGEAGETLGISKVAVYTGLWMGIVRY